MAFWALFRKKGWWDGDKDNDNDGDTDDGGRDDDNLFSEGEKLGTLLAARILRTMNFSWYVQVKGKNSAISYNTFKGGNTDSGFRICSRKRAMSKIN